jgi:hypothetical protein
VKLFANDALDPDRARQRLLEERCRVRMMTSDPGNAKLKAELLRLDAELQAFDRSGGAPG